MSQDREPVPAPIKRLLRQRFGFGCAFCGSPIYDYEHIEGYAVTGHDPNAMTLLCPGHHRDKTVGRLPVALVREASRDPFNGRRRFTRTHPLFFDPAKPLVLRVGTLTIKPGEVGSMVGLVVDGDMAMGVGLSDIGHPTVELDLRDLDDRVIIRAVRGELRLATTPWDITWEGRTITIRRGQRQFLLRLTLDPDDNQVVVETADIALHHVRIRMGAAADGGGLTDPDDNASVSGGILQGGGFQYGLQPAPYRPVFVTEHPRRAYGTPPAPMHSIFTRLRP